MALEYNITRLSGDISYVYDEVQTEPYGIAWTDGYNSFNNESDIPPASETTPLYVRLVEPTSFSFFKKTLLSTPDSSALRIDITVNGNEHTDYYELQYIGKNWLTLIDNSGTLTISLERNTVQEDRDFQLTITNAFDPTDTHIVYIRQEHKVFSVVVTSATITSGTRMAPVPTTHDGVTYTFDDLLEDTDNPYQLLHCNVSAIGGYGRFTVRSIQQYTPIGDTTTDTSFVHVGSKWYRTITDAYGEVRRFEVTIRNNLAYQTTMYNDGLKVVSDSRTFVDIYNYGRTSMNDGDFYILTLIHRDDASKRCYLEVHHADLP